MKKALLMITLCATLAACSSEEPATDGKQPSGQTETQEVKKEQLFKYFGLNKSLTVYQALQKLKATSGEKTIDGKTLTVTAVDETNRNEQTGTLTVTVKGSISGKPFKQTVTFEGFAPKPADGAMAKRVVATWKSDMDYQKDFDFDTLYRLGNTDKFTTEYLSRFINFTSSTPDGKYHYTFTPEDIAKTVVNDIKYTPSNRHEGTLSFILTYNGIKGNTGSGANGAPSLLFDKDIYYQKQVSLNRDAVRSLYMRGVYENADVFYAGLLKYDRTRFVPRIVHKVRNDNDNSMLITIKLTANDGRETELEEFGVIIDGFKSLADLNKDLQLAGSTEVGKHLGKVFRNAPDGDKLSQMSTVPVQAWIEKVQMGIRRDGKLIDLLPQKVSTGSGSSIVTVWKPTSGDGSVLDLYFESPRFEVVEAQKQGNFLKMKLKLNAVNETSVQGVELPLTVHLLQP